MNSTGILDDYLDELLGEGIAPERPAGRRDPPPRRPPPRADQHRPGHGHRSRRRTRTHLG